MNKVISQIQLQLYLGTQTIWLPINPVFLDVQMWGGALTMWAIVDPNLASTSFDVTIVGSGQPLPDRDYVN